ncbi:Serine/threonine kinase [Marasmius tenuissimus]|nr:Serine/threonine kinase [Marasmius tenuissimus]
MGSKFSEPLRDRRFRQTQPVLNDFHLMSPVSMGYHCDMIRKVEHKLTGDLCALKYMNKGHYARKRAIESLVRERMLLSEINHPLIVNLRSAFQDQDYCYFVLDLVEGGDLSSILQSHPSISEHVKKIWIAEVALAISYLHVELKIVHRDVKPSHILLDSLGHAHLSGFHIATRYERTKKKAHACPPLDSSSDLFVTKACMFTSGSKLTSITGTLPYMAPEILERKGYSWEVDWWSLGVTAYELLFRELPFGPENDDATQTGFGRGGCSTRLSSPSSISSPSSCSSASRWSSTDGQERARETERAILADELEFPEDAEKWCSDEGIDAIACLLERDPLHRLGCRRIRTGSLFRSRKTRKLGITDVQNHPWFIDVAWGRLYHKKDVVDLGVR